MRLGIICHKVTVVLGHSMNIINLAFILTKHFLSSDYSHVDLHCLLSFCFVYITLSPSFTHTTCYSGCIS